jgi:hypothetical protein
MTDRRRLQGSAVLDKRAGVLSWIRPEVNAADARTPNESGAIEEAREADTGLAQQFPPACLQDEFKTLKQPDADDAICNTGPERL